MPRCFLESDFISGWVQLDHGFNSYPRLTKSVESGARRLSNRATVQKETHRTVCTRRTTGPALRTIIPMLGTSTSTTGTRITTIRRIITTSDVSGDGTAQDPLFLPGMLRGIDL